jgi:hypothetical protein
VIKKKAPGATHILDRYHIMAMLNKGSSVYKRELLGF